MHLTIQTNRYMKSILAFKTGLILLVAVLLSCGNEKAEVVQVEEVVEQTVAEPVAIVENEPGKMKLEKILYPNGELKMEGNSTDGVKEGKWTSWYENGMIWSETYFENGKKDGSTATWFPNGKKRYEGFFKNGVESGKWKYWDEAGNLMQEVNYD